MVEITKRLSVLLCVLFATASSAQAARLSVIVAGIYDKQGAGNLTQSAGFNEEYKPGQGLGAGLLYELDLFSVISLELGALYGQREHVYRLTNTSTSAYIETTNRYRAVDVPLLLRVWPLSWLSIGAGGYWSSGLGKVRNEVFSSSVNAGVFSDKSFGDANFHARDYGISGSLGLHFSVGGSASLMLVTRSMFGLCDRLINKGTDTDRTLKTRSTQAMLGIQWDLGSSSGY